MCKLRGKGGRWRVHHCNWYRVSLHIHNQVPIIHYNLEAIPFLLFYFLLLSLGMVRHVHKSPPPPSAPHAPVPFLSAYPLPPPPLKKFPLFLLSLLLYFFFCSLFFPVFPVLINSVLVRFITSFPIQSVLNWTNSECAADFSLLNLPKGKSLGRSKPATDS